MPGLIDRSNQICFQFILFVQRKLVSSLYTSSNSGSRSATKQLTSTFLHFYLESRMAHKHLSVMSLNPAWQGSHRQTSPQHHYQSSECSMAGTPHRQSERSQQTCRSLLLRSAKALPLLGGLRVASRVKWKPSSLKLLQV